LRFACPPIFREAKVCLLERPLWALPCDFSVRYCLFLRRFKGNGVGCVFPEGTTAPQVRSYGAWLAYTRAAAAVLFVFFLAVRNLRWRACPHRKIQETQRSWGGFFVALFYSPVGVAKRLRRIRCSRLVLSENAPSFCYWQWLWSPVLFSLLLLGCRSDLLALLSSVRMAFSRGCKVKGVAHRVF
jgi:hypothetical protein